MNIALIPAKGYSRRIPRKNMMDFCGKPLFMWSVEQAKASKLVDKIVVSTDDNEIAWLAIKGGAEVVRREGVSDSQTMEEVIEHFIQAEDISNQAVIICLQPTSPLRLPEDIDSCIERYAMSVNVLRDLYLWESQNRPVTFSRHNRERFNAEVYEENGSIYCINAEDFRKTKSRYVRYPMFYCMQKWQSFEIDEIEDIEICEYFMRKYIINNGSYYSYI